MSSKTTDIVSPAEIVDMLGDKGKLKVNTPSLKLINSAATAGMMAGMATILMVKVTSDKNLPGGHFIGAALFPMAFVFIVLTGSDLFTGNVVCTTIATLSGKIRLLQAARPWACVLFGNFLGCLCAGLAYFLIHSDYGLKDCPSMNIEAIKTSEKASKYDVPAMLCQIALKKVYSYMIHDEFARGWFVCLTKGIIVNWLVCLATVLVFASQHVIARIVAMWLPIIVFATVGYEHIVVNFFVIPTGWMFHTPQVVLQNTPQVTVAHGIFMNIVPTLLGNITGGIILAFQLFYNHGKHVREVEHDYEQTVKSASDDVKVVETPSTHHSCDEVVLDV